jgi:aminopeptidase-like protein
LTVNNAWPSDELIEAIFDESRVPEFGASMFELAEELWPLNRSLTGAGNRETLAILKREFPDLLIHEVPSGTEAFDWTVPDEWTIRAGWIKAPSGEVLCDFVENNLHVVGYSEPVHTTISLAELQEHLYSLPEQPDAIPYVTSYYNRHWGFCLSEERRAQLEDGDYEVFIDSDLLPGSLSYGEIIIQGDEASEVLLSTYICHPSMANNELSGVVVALQLAKWLSALPSRKHTYRILFVPETIGPIVYLSKHLEHLKKHVIAGYVLTCVGDDRSYSYIPSRNGETLADKVALHVLKHLDPNFNRYTWAERQSDERQYCAPHVDLPVASMMRTKYGSYPEYHTSLDTLGAVVTPEGLAGAMLAYIRAIQILELDFYPVVTTICEPQLGKRDLYPTISKKGNYERTWRVRELLSLADGSASVRALADLCRTTFPTLVREVRVLTELGILGFPETQGVPSSGNPTAKSP